MPQPTRRVKPRAFLLWSDNTNNCTIKVLQLKQDNAFVLFASYCSEAWRLAEHLYNAHINIPSSDKDAQNLSFFLSLNDLSDKRVVIDMGF